jgi:tyrosyl-tRNA synthetase
LVAGGVLDELEERGLLALSTDREGLAAALAAGPVTFYVGFDPTAPSLHFGHLVQLIVARRLQLAGHRPVLLIGGATGLIGDPRESGERTLNPTDVVAGWVDRLRAQVTPYLDFDGPAAARVVNNLDWTAPLSAIELLRDIGKHFSVNRMLDREAVSVRLAAGGISYTEFSYVILQSFDYLRLHRDLGCALQLGGSDQWGNITAGVELIRRVTTDRVHALATPLITKPDGTKFGKSEGGSVWLDPSLTSPYAFFQYWLNVADEQVGSLLRIFTFRTADEIRTLEAETVQRPGARAGHRVLARDVTTMVHGAEAAAGVEAASAALFGSGDFAALEPGVLTAALETVPHLALRSGEQLPPVDELFARTGLVASVSAARRTVAEGGAYVNNSRITDPGLVPDGLLVHDRWLVLRRGRRALAAVDALARGDQLPV